MPNNIFSKFFLTLKTVIATIFGQVSWRSPAWLVTLRNRAAVKPGHFWGSVCAIIILGVGAAYAYCWYKKLPRPEVITAHITAPQITKVDKDLIPDNLIVDFGIEGNEFIPQSVAPLQLVGKELPTGIIMVPAMPGQWMWENGSRLIFTPEQDWPAGQKYTLHFAKNFFANPKKMQSDTFTFSTQPFKLAISEFKFYQDPIDAAVRQAVATITFNYPVDTNSFENKILLAQQALKKNLTLGGQGYKFIVSYDEHKRIAYLHSETLPITEVERYIDLQINKGVKAAKGPSESQETVKKNLLIPDASSYFKITAAGASIVRDEKDRPEQVLTIETSVGVQQAALNKALHVYLLPQDYPASATEEAQKDYQWQNPGEVSANILALSKPLDMQAIPAERDYSTLHSYKFEAATPRFIYLKLDKGVTSFGNFVLTHDYVAVIKVPEYPREIGFLHKGALLALNSEKKLSVLVRGLPAVKFEVARVMPGDVNQLITQSRGDFNNPRFINPSFNEQNISEIFSEIQQFDASDLAKAQYGALDLTKYLGAKANTAGPQGLFLLQAYGWDTETNLALDVKSSRLILVTDLGLLVKDNGDGSHDVFVQSITQGKPVAGAVISLLGKNGLPILTRTTDVQGRANFPTVKDFIEEREPTVYLAQFHNDVAFMPFNNFERQLNFSKFDIGGVYNSDQDQQTLSAFVFSDRGIYRPGDTAHIAMIVKQAYVQAQPAGLPLQATIIDPRGMTVKDQRFTLDASGFLALDFATEANSPTGQYTINLFIVKDNHPSSLLGSTSIRVEEFLPDNMRITTHLSAETLQGWVSPVDLKGNVSLWNLYGAPATNRKIAAKILLTPQAVRFEQFPQYTFFDPLLDPLKPPKVFTETLAETHTNDLGQATLDLRLDRFEKATYQLTFFAEGFEADAGRSVSAKTSVLVSPLEYLVGYKTDGDLSYMKQNETRHVNFIAVNPQLQQLALSGLKLQLLSLHPVSTLVKKPNGTYQYQTLMQISVVNTTNFDVAAAGSDYALPTQQIGDFAIAILDKNNTELSRLKFSVVGASQLPLPKNAELTVKLNKAEYLPEEDIELQIIAPYTGSGLITIERDKVYATQWFQASTTSFVQKIHIPKDFQGNGYINVSFVRDWNSPEIFISPLSYNVTPFMVNHANRALKIDLNVPAIARPGEPLVINYKSDKPGKIIVFAVDEGILQAAGFQTPDPLAFFFQKHALEVNTLQTLDQILPKFIQERELSAVGGGNGDAALQTLNPFKRKTELPIVYWSGILDTDATLRQLSYLVPDYFNGALRVMAVAVAADAVGSATKMAEVRGNFVITPNVPTFVAPGDEFEVTASIANNVAGSGAQATVTVEMLASPALQVLGKSKQTLQIAEGKEQTTHFKLKATPTLGSATINFTAGIQDKTSKINSTLSIRPASAYSTTLQSGYARDGEKTLALDKIFYPEFRAVEAAMSTSPLILVVGLNRYLENFPYGCTEQLTSKAMPLLALASQPWYAKDTQAITDKIQLTIQMLAQRQMSSGGFSYWPGTEMNQNNPFASVYAMHFLTEARAQGYNVPIDLLRSGITYLKDLAAQTVTTLDDARTQAYAIYVLTRNEIVTTNYLTNLQIYLDQDTKRGWHQDIMSAYMAATYELLKSHAEAQRLIDYYQPQKKIETQTSDFYNQSIADAQYLYLIARHFPNRLPKLTDTVVMPLVNTLNSGEMNTVLSGYASLAFSAYSQFNPAASGSALSIMATVAGKKTTLAVPGNAYQKVAVEELAQKIHFQNATKQGYFYQLSEAGFDKKLATSAIKQGMEVFREYRDPEQGLVDGVNLGSEVEVHIQIRALNDRYLNNIAIIDLLPGGFEVVRNSVKLDNIDYADIREDRVIFFTGVGPEVKEIVYRIKATNMGDYTVPAIFASSMYDPNIVARNVGGKMAVTNLATK